MTDEKAPDTETAYAVQASGAPVVRDDDIKATLEAARYWLDVCFVPYVEAELASRPAGAASYRAADLAVLRTGADVLRRLEMVLRNIEMRELSLLWFQSAYHRHDGGVELIAGSPLLAAVKRLVGDG